MFESRDSWCVLTGRMMETVERLDLTNKTMMYFTSDHGGHIEDSDEQGQKGGWNGVYRGLTHRHTKAKLNLMTLKDINV